ncbi:MAG: ABC transporter ATP-binding protein/permease, partial [Methanomassiliicoccales archaeon]|nr:ABC transporter ATP-binding protein/permease [Methanomassiliicoccales archaeon]
MVALGNIARLFVLYKKSWRFILISQLFVLASSTVIILIPYEVQNLINDGVLLGAAGEDQIISSVITILLLAFLYALFISINIMMAVAFSEGTADYLRRKTFEKVQTYSVKNYDEHSTGELMSRLNNDIYQINMAVQLAMRFLLAAPFTIIIAVVAVLLFSPDLAWIFLIVIPLMAVVLWLVARRLQKQYKQRQNKLDASNNRLQENFSGVRVVKAFMRQEYEKQTYEKANNEYRQAALAPMRTQYWILPSMFAIIGVSTAIAVWVGGQAAFTDPTKVGALVAFSQYLLMILIQMFNLSILLPQLSSADISAGRIRELLKVEPDIKEPATPKSTDPSVHKGRVVFENVAFKYGSGDEPETVKNISFVAEPGETVAFLGSTGCGKSTLINLIPRFYDVTAGKITIDDIDVKDIPQEILRQIVVPVLQESILFSGDVRENIKMGKPEATDDEMEVAAKAADAHKFLTSTPEGYDRRVSRRGTNFSGG